MTEHPTTAHGDPGPDHVGGRVAGLAPPAHRLLAHLTIAGTVPADVLLAAVGLPPDAFDDACRTLREVGLVELTPDGSVAVSTPDVVDEVRAGILPGERRAVHAAVADALLSADHSRDASWSAALSEHLHACGRHVHALPHTVRAARQAVAHGAVKEAGDRFTLARRWWPDGVTSLDGITWVDVLCESADAARLRGDPRAALALAREAAAHPEVTPHQAARIAIAEARAWLAAGGPEEATAALHRALATAVGEGVESRVGVLVAVAQVELLRGRSEQARSVAEDAVALADADPGVASESIVRYRLHAIITIAATDAQQGATSTALQRLRDCLPEVRRSDDLELILRAYGNLS